MDRGSEVPLKASGKRWLAIGLTLAIAVAIVEAVWFTSAAGPTGGPTATDPANHDNQAVPGPATLSTNQATEERLDRILDAAHATPYVVTQATKERLDRILDAAHATPYVVTQATKERLDSILDGAHAVPFRVTPVVASRSTGR
jgi:hypothetical protein